MEQVVLVDENDNEVGVEEKIKAHQNGGKLHRAFSIVVFNSEGKMLIQKRASSKYHWPGIWANTCCSHPRPGEKLDDAVKRRLEEEMGFQTELSEVHDFVYRASFDNGLTEWELDHVFVGVFDGEPNPNPDEVGDYKWINLEDLKNDLSKNGDKYAPWFKIIIENVDFEKKLDNFLSQGPK